MCLKVIPLERPTDACRHFTLHGSLHVLLCRPDRLGHALYLRPRHVQMVRDDSFSFLLNCFPAHILTSVLLDLWHVFSVIYLYSERVHTAQHSNSVGLNCWNSFSGQIPKSFQTKYFRKRVNQFCFRCSPFLS